MEWRHSRGQQLALLALAMSWMFGLFIISAMLDKLRARLDARIDALGERLVANIHPRAS
ncbi:MAG: hypothetical protein ACRD1T_12420 [Acidimicrobiia bacterium]